MKIALAGNPNCGKTTLFNALTKTNQKVGNWPGVTTERKEGQYFDDKNLQIIDLPGVYSLNPVSADEKITCDYLLSGRPDAVINVADATNLERNLHLTLQILETGIPAVIALNMGDELKLHGLTINCENIEKELHCPAVIISARKRTGIADLIAKVRLLNAERNGKAVKYFGRNEKYEYTEEERANCRQNFIKERINLFCARTTDKTKKITAAIDKIVLNKWLAFPIFAALIWLMYFFAIQIVGVYGTAFCEWLFYDIIGDGLRIWLDSINSPNWISALLTGGIIAAVGAVLSFIPQIIVLFVFISFLDDCGYMSRIAIIMDRLFNWLGLSGKAFIPMIIGTGCSVPAIMSAKILDNEKERINTIILTPFVPCSAKWPVFALFAGAIFPNNYFAAPSLYFFGIFMVIAGAMFLKLFNKDSGGKDIFIMELPNYRLPQWRNTVLDIWNKVKNFVVRAGVIIVPLSMELWFLQNFNIALQMVNVENSILATFGSLIAWIFVPLGFGNWQSAIAVITGVLAKETVVASFGVVLGGEENLYTALAALFTPWGGYAFMAFILLSTPCMAAIAAMRKELNNNKVFWSAILFQCAAGYAVALAINQFGNLYNFSPAVFISAVAIVCFIIIFILCILRAVRHKGACSGDCAKCGCNCGRENKGQKLCLQKNEIKT
jgi:ferrous iron transport protein B